MQKPRPMYAKCKDFRNFACYQQLVSSETTVHPSIGMETCSALFWTVFEQLSETRKISSWQIFSRKNEKSWFFTKKTIFFQKFRFHSQNYYKFNLSLQVPFVTYVVLDDTF